MDDPEALTLGNIYIHIPNIYTYSYFNQGCLRAKRKSRIRVRKARWFFSDSQQAFRDRIRLFRFARGQP